MSARVFLVLFLVSCFHLSAQSTSSISFDPQAPSVTSPPSNTPPEQRCTVAGRVANALTGEPVKKVNVRLIGTRPGAPASPVSTVRPSSGGQGYSTSTGQDGTFRIEGIEPGQYILSAARAGFIALNYGAKTPTGRGTPLRLSPAQQVTDLSLILSPQPVISGKVLDEDGDAVNGGFIQIYAQTWVRGKLQYQQQGGTQINDLGEFRIANLRPGRYYVAAQSMPSGSPPSGIPGKPDVNPVRTFYPSSITLANAAPIDLKLGQDVSAVNIRLQAAQTFHIRGRILGNLPEGSSARERLMVSVSARGESSIGMHGAMVKPDGSFDAPGLPPGAYTVTAMLANGRVRSAGRVDVDLGSMDLDNIAIMLAEPGSMRGLVRIEGTPASNTSPVSAAKIRVTLAPIQEGAPFMGQPAQAKMNEDGTFTLDNVSSTKFIVQVTAPPGTYLKAIRHGPTELIGRELDLTGGVGGDLELIFRYGAAQVSGTVQAPDPQGGTGEQSGPSAQVLLIPEVLNADGSGILSGTTDDKGKFGISPVSPGRYRAYAFEEVNVNEVQNPDVLKQLEQKGTSLDVKENEQKQVQLPLISIDDLQQVFAKAGIEHSVQ